MMQFVVKYQKAIDAITTDKSLKYELDNNDWAIIHDLVTVLEVCFQLLLIFSIDSSFNSNTKSYVILFTGFSQHCGYQTSYGQT
jgi:hypothetical protein